MLEDGDIPGHGGWHLGNPRGREPRNGELEDKRLWLVEHDGLVFGSGWHHDASGR